MNSHRPAATLVAGLLAAAIVAGEASAADALPCNDWCRAWIGSDVETAPHVVMGDATRARSKIVDYFYALNEDCSSAGAIQLGIVQQPLQGSLSEDDARERVFFPADSARAACNKRKAPSLRLFYTRGADFTGSDAFVVQVTYPDGTTSVMRYEITAIR